MKKVLSTLLLATLMLSVVAVAGVVPVRAAVVGTLEVSSPYFWENAVLLVKLYDPDLVGTNFSTITYSINGASPSPMTLKSPLKNGEFFGYFADNDTNITAIVTTHPYGDVTINQTQPNLGSKATITFRYMDSSPVGTVTATANYEEYKSSAADLTFDRASLEYPLDGYMRIYIKDYDYNLDPTAADSKNITILFHNITEGIIGNVTKLASETDAASGVFMLTIGYNTTLKLVGDVNFGGLPSGTPIKVVYVLDNPSKWITLKSYPVSLVVPSSFTTRGDLTITLRDPNLNLRSWESERINGTILNTYVNVTMGSDFVLLNLEETGKDTGEFRAKVPVVIGSATFDDKLQVAVGTTKATIRYYFNSTDVVRAETTSTLSTTAATITSDLTMYRKDAKAKLTLTAPDINDDVDNPNFFTCHLPGGNATIKSLNVTYQTQTIGELTIDVNGLVARSGVNESLVFLETGADTDKFTVSLDLTKIRGNDNSTLSDGDTVVVRYYDVINDATSSVTFKIGVPAATISLDRSTYPVPKDGPVKIRITVTDSDKNRDANLIETATAYVDVFFYNGTRASSVSVTVKETDPNTGIFRETWTLSQSNESAYINGWVRANYLDPASGKNVTATATLRATDATISVDKTTVKAGDKLTVTVRDSDKNLDSGTSETVSVEYEYTNPAGAKISGTWTLTETGVNTGIFTYSRTIGSHIFVKPGSTITLTYLDPTPSYITAAAGYPADPVKYTASAKVATFTGTLAIDKTEYGLGSKMTITVTDPDLNTDITSKQSTTVTLRIEGEADSSLTLNEDALDSGVFKVEHTWGTNKTLIGKTFMVYYKDDANAAGETAYVIARGSIKSWDGTVAFDKTYYNLEEVAVIVVTDPDANLNSALIETIQVTIVSDSDPLGQTITATETGANTGVFEGRIQISSTFAAGRVFAKLGDTVTAKYIDSYPADYATTEKTKTFTRTAVVGVPIARPVPASAQKFADPTTGAEVTTGAVGKAVMLQTTLKNVDATSKSFTAIFKVKDAAGVTIFISWVTGTLAAGQELTPAVSWTPSVAGSYTVEVLVVKTLAEPTPYSDPLSKALTVV